MEEPGAAAMQAQPRADRISEELKTEVSQQNAAADDNDEDEEEQERMRNEAAAQ